MEKIDILSLSPEMLGQYLAEMGEPKFRAKQLFSWLHQKQVTSFDQMTTLSLQLRQKLNEKFCINRLNIARKLASAADDTVKYLYELPDGNFVETVLMEYHHGKSLCISTQVGCRRGVSSVLLLSPAMSGIFCRQSCCCKFMRPSGMPDAALTASCSWALVSRWTILTMWCSSFGFCPIPTVCR